MDREKYYVQFAEKLKDRATLKEVCEDQERQDEEELQIINSHQKKLTNQEIANLFNIPIDRVLQVLNQFNNE